MSETRKKVEMLIEEIRAGLQADHGDIELVDVADDGTVLVKLDGACASCPMSHYTMAFGVERLLKERIPEVKQVKAVKGLDLP